MKMKTNDTFSTMHEEKVIYSCKRETVTLREAENSGFFASVDDRLVASVQSSLTQHERKKDSLFILDLSLLRIRWLERLSAYQDLTILLLANNFIKHIDALASCSKLLKLDLHGNQISRLPDQSFWKELRCLRILYLHDNPIGKYVTIEGMSACPALSILTLFDTPLSLRRHYRHHVVNTLCSLRALDQHVVSDEEIIEDARFGGRFGALSQAMRFSPMLSKERSAEVTLASDVWKLINCVNLILSHCSPVVIIQRWWRGYLTRCAIRWAMSAELWAAVTIQKWFRKWKTGKWKELNTSIPPPPPSSTPVSVESSSLLVKFDYVSYLKSRKPLSSTFGKILWQSLRQGKELTEATHEATIFHQPFEPLYFNLEMFKTQVKHKLSKEIKMKESDKVGETAYNQQNLRKVQMTRSEILPLKQQNIKSVKELLHPKSELIGNSDTDEDLDNDAPLAVFRLRGFRAKVELCDLREKIAEMKLNCAQSVRLADDIGHVIQSLRPKPKVTRMSVTEVRERKERKYQGAYWLVCLQAVEKENRRAAAAERDAHQASCVQSRKRERDDARERIHAHLVNQRRKTTITDQIRRRSFAEDRWENVARSSQVLLRYNALRHRSAQFEKIRRYEAAFAREFVGRTASCTKADFKFGEQEMRERQARFKREFVSEMRNVKLDCKDLWQTYKKEQTTSLQNQLVSEKKELKEKISENAQEQTNAAQQRVTEAKSKNPVKRSKTALTLPIISNRQAPV